MSASSPMRSLLGPEARFLVLTAVGEANDAVMREVLGGPFDWNALCTLARKANALPVVWRSLQRLGCEVPPKTAEYLSGAAVVSEFELLRAELRLNETIRALNDEGIRVVLLKGAAVVHTAYESFTERPMSDFDLLVEPGRIEDAQRIAQGLGWTRSRSAAPDDVYRTHHHAAPLVDTRGTGMQLELHTALVIEGHPFGLSPDLVRRRARPIQIDGCLVGVPSRAILMLHACLHFAWSHCMQTGGWRTMRDIAHLAEGRPHVWDELLQLATDARGATCCYWTLRLTRDLAGIDVPEHVLEALKPPLSETVLNRLARHFVLHLFGSEVVCPSEYVERVMWTAAIRPGWSGHRTARPWTHTHAFMRNRQATSGALLAGTTLARQVGRIPQWGRYLRALLADPGTPFMASARDGV